MKELVFEYRKQSSQRVQCSLLYSCDVRGAVRGSEKGTVSDCAYTTAVAHCWEGWKGSFMVLDFSPAEGVWHSYVWHPYLWAGSSLVLGFECSLFYMVSHYWFPLLQIEIDNGDELTADFLYDEVHPKQHAHKQSFAKPKGPAGKRGIRRLIRGPAEAEATTD